MKDLFDSHSLTVCKLPIKGIIKIFRKRDITCCRSPSPPPSHFVTPIWPPPYPSDVAYFLNSPQECFKGHKGLIITQKQQQNKNDFLLRNVTVYQCLNSLTASAPSAQSLRFTLSNGVSVAEVAKSQAISRGGRRLAREPTATTNRCRRAECEGINDL